MKVELAIQQEWEICPLNLCSMQLWILLKRERSCNSLICKDNTRVIAKISFREAIQRTMVEERLQQDTVLRTSWVIIAMILQWWIRYQLLIRVTETKNIKLGPLKISHRHKQCSINKFSRIWECVNKRLNLHIILVLRNSSIMTMAYPKGIQRHFHPIKIRIIHFTCLAKLTARVTLQMSALITRSNLLF